MEDIRIDIREWNKWYRDRFPNKDLITFDELLSDYEDLIDEVEHLEEEIRDLRRDMDENYKPLPPDPDPYEYRL